MGFPSAPPPPAPTRKSSTTIIALFVGGMLALAILAVVFVLFNQPKAPEADCEPGKVCAPQPSLPPVPSNQPSPLPSPLPSVQPSVQPSPGPTTVPATLPPGNLFFIAPTRSTEYFSITGQIDFPALRPAPDDAPVDPDGRAGVAVAVEELWAVVAEEEPTLDPGHRRRVERGQQGDPGGGLRGRAGIVLEDVARLARIGLPLELDLDRADSLQRLPRQEPCDRFIIHHKDDGTRNGLRIRRVFHRSGTAIPKHGFRTVLD